jgi:hypothetical protein
MCILSCFHQILYFNFNFIAKINKYYHLYLQLVFISLVNITATKQLKVS